MVGRTEMQARLDEIAGRIEAAAQKSGRRAEDVTLVAVSKFQPLASLYTALDCGVTIFGENRVQEREEKSVSWASERHEPVLWHMVGHLQRNKARKALELFDCVQSVDGFELASTLDRILAERTADGAEPGRFPIFIEVNTSGEVSKNGVTPEMCVPLVERIIAECPFLAVEGLMTIGPLTESVGAVRASFSLLRELAENARERTGLPMSGLSMGMTGDYEIAIEEGSTLVRIGTGIFGTRTLA